MSLSLFPKKMTQNSKVSRLAMNDNGRIVIPAKIRKSWD